MVDLAGIDQVVALAPAEIDAIEPVGLQAKPAIGSVSRRVQVFFYPIVAAAGFRGGKSSRCWGSRGPCYTSRWRRG
jgi:hypothetical protein